MQILRTVIRNILLERKVWGIGGAGILVCCSKDGSVLLQKRSLHVSGGAGQWAYPGGGIHVLNQRERFWMTPISPEYVLQDNSERFLETAFAELEEETGWIPSSYNIVDSYIYEFEGFKYKTIIIDIPLSVKQTYSAKDFEDEHSWEVDDEGWFEWNELIELDLFFGFTPVLLSKLKKVIGT